MLVVTALAIGMILVTVTVIVLGVSGRVAGQNTTNSFQIGDTRHWRVKSRLYIVIACFRCSAVGICGFAVDNACTYNDPRAVEYMGKKQTNELNVTCIMWSAQRAYPASQFPDPDLLSAGNFCRNPKPVDSKAWCYTSQDAARKWGYCALRQCGNVYTSAVPR